MSNFGKVAVLLGGPSNEREVSLMSGGAVLAALRERGVDAHAFDPAQRPLAELVRDKFQRVFIALHGRFGEDGTVQGALEVMGIPYTGSGVLASALALDKMRTKQIWRSVGVPTAAFFEMHSADDAAEVLKTLGAPVMVKPVREGSTLGITKASDEASLREAYRVAVQCDPIVMAESFIAGRELTVAVLDGRALPIIHIEAPDGNYDYQNKYFTNTVKKHCPAALKPGLTEAIQADTLKAFKALDCRGCARADVMLRDDGAYFFLEINTSPGMTDHSLVPIAAKQVGIAFPDLCVRILSLASCERPAAHVG